MPMDFQAGIRPPDEHTGPSLWFPFREDKLLVAADGRTASLPRASALEELGIHPLRVQYLGTADGTPCYSAELAADSPEPPGYAFMGLRQLFGIAGDGLFKPAGLAFQVMSWDRTHRYCGACGKATRDDPAERAKVCPDCGLKSFPRISPAVIVSVVRGGKILLARARRFPVKLYSVIAGFVEPGETLEECVEREVREETGVTVKNLRYFGSQPWPFPNSLMIAFTAQHAGGEIAVDENEIVDAGWFSPREFPPIPDKISIARRLIDRFTEGNTAQP